MNGIAQALISRAQPLFTQQKIQDFLAREAIKGCAHQIVIHPVSLEPSYGNELPSQIPIKPLDTRLQIWISPNEKINWVHCESFLKQLSGLTQRIGFEITGNCSEISLSFLCEEDSADLIHAAFLSQFPFCRITQQRHMGLGNMILKESVYFRDYYPPPPYSHLFTSMDELRESPLLGFLHTLSQIPADSFGFYQCLFQPVQHNWHQSVELLTDLEYQLKLNSGLGISPRHLQQTPSGDLRSSAVEVDLKAHNDKPFYSVAVRLGVMGERRHLESLGLFMNLFQHGGKPMQFIDETEYLKHFSASELTEMIHSGLCYRHGFLLNSKELAGLVHPISTQAIDSVQLPIETLEPLTLADPTREDGTNVGYYSDAGIEQSVYIPDDIRERGTHIIGGSGSGKTTLEEEIFMQDIQRGIGAVYIDPHGDAITDICNRLDEEQLSRCIYFDPGNQDFTPLWNPLYLAKGADPFRQADDLLSTFEHVFTGWGDRLAHVLRNGLIGLSYLKNPCLLDLYHLLRQKSDESNLLREQILAQPGLDEPVRSFWEHDFLKDYRESELAAPKHKLSKLLSGSVYSMFSQRESKIDLNQIMDESMILLVDLSNLGADTKQVLGSLMLTMFMATALTRSKQEEAKRTPFSIFADECHMFVSASAIEDMITQARKFKIRLTIAHQYLSQFQSGKVDALSTTGTTLVGRVNKNDSRHFAKDMRDLVKPEELLALAPFEFVGRIGTEVVKFKTKAPPSGGKSIREQIIAHSQEYYCVPSAKLRRKVASPVKSGEKTRIDLSAFEFSAEDFLYDEF